MKHYRYSLLSVAIITACYSQYAAADLRHQCLSGVPHFEGEVLTGDQTQMPVYIEADNALINQPTDATYTGDVSIKQGNRTVWADQVRVEQNGGQARTAYLNGRFDYRDNLIRATGQNAQIDLTGNHATLGNADYQLVGRQGRGTAESVSANEQTRILKNASFTACLPNDNAWSIDASEMIQHVKEEYAELWHARFRVMGVPVFYSPYLQFPIGDRRRSGLLIPNVGRSSRDGYYYSQPIYWNIAPNMDATITPTYYTRRGWQISPEFRYLTAFGEGKMAGEYVKRDRLPSWTEKDRSRHLFFWQHNVNFLSDWRFSVDYTHVSDKRYFSDFDSAYGNSTDGYATQNFKLGYFQPHYNISISGKRFQTFDDSGSKPYRVLPKVELNYYKNDLVKHGDFSLYAQSAYFANDSKEMPTAWRFHLQPALNFPLANRYASLNLETKLYATHYLQKKGGAENAEAIERSVTRVLPQLKLDLKTVLSAKQNVFSGFSQTFEPRVQYLYRPYKNQANIGSQRQSSLGLGYDSALLQQDYYALFNDRRYSGLDRIASANQITAGGTTRFFSNETGEEVFNFSAGQIYYLSPSKIDSTSINSTAKRSSSWALESNWKFHPKWNWHGGYQYDTRLNETSLANMALQYKPKANNVVQLNYRYASKNYIDQNLSSNRYGQDIKQVGAVIGWELTDSVSMMASHYRDIALKKPVESQLGLTYNTCCWSATFYATRKLTATPEGKPDTLNDFYYDNRFGLNFELRFGSGYNSGVSRMLKRGMIPYTEAFNIN
ncbi:LPS assembly protein LptD [Muribacter muris]|uniref:LPS-assembly protein LptD n=1 Tax=Muribacter muris TaxID=67855 RepID=A0A4Y9K7G4_9PAST|nr:LPS assembly protein LptD [Muribacter muris]MBF0784313.1 LPS assembly protein LptD [Muribacter muris]MBF0826950.1 LPS assembly protein LptD [Muribacter muris]TFV13050.1 LPS assembly protein LptD [Muribacter muris]